VIGQQEFMELKQRMLIAAEAAYKIAASSDPFVMHDQEQYELVITALLALKADARRLMAEHDILRGMFAEKIGAFFMEGFKDESTGRAPDVEGVPRPESVGGGEAPRADQAGTDGAVLGVETPRKRTRRSKPRGNRAADSDVPVELERDNGAVAVDGSKDGQ
jgi:hypothetical protein